MSVVWTCSSGGDYTKEKVYVEIEVWLNEPSPFSQMSEAERSRAKEIIYPILMDLLKSGNCDCTPYTRLSGLDEDDVDYILELLYP